MCSNVDVDMLRVTMMNRVSCHIDSTDFVPVDHRQKKNMWYMKFLQKVVLHNGMFHNVLFCLCTRTGDCTLTLENHAPWHQIIADKDTVTRHVVPRGESWHSLPSPYQRMWLETIRDHCQYKTQ